MHNRTSEGIDLLDVFIYQLPSSIPPSAESFFRRFKISEVLSSLKNLLNVKATNQADDEDDMVDDDFARSVSFDNSRSMHFVNTKAIESFAMKNQGSMIEDTVAAQKTMGT